MKKIKLSNEIDFDELCLEPGEENEKKKNNKNIIFTMFQDFRNERN